LLEVGFEILSDSLLRSANFLSDSCQPFSICANRSLSTLVRKASPAGDRQADAYEQRDRLPDRLANVSSDDLKSIDAGSDFGYFLVELFNLFPQRGDFGIGR